MQAVVILAEHFPVALVVLVLALMLTSEPFPWLLRSIEFLAPLPLLLAAAGLLSPFILVAAAAAVASVGLIRASCAGGQTAGAVGSVVVDVEMSV